MSQQLTPLQRQAILDLLEHPAVADAALGLAMRTSTVYRWLRNPIVRRILQFAGRRLARRISPA